MKIYKAENDKFIYFIILSKGASKYFDFTKSERLFASIPILFNKSEKKLKYIYLPENNLNTIQNKKEVTLFTFFDFLTKNVNKEECIKFIEKLHSYCYGSLTLYFSLYEIKNEILNNEIYKKFFTEKNLIKIKEQKKLIIEKGTFLFEDKYFNFKIKMEKRKNTNVWVELITKDGDSIGQTDYEEEIVKINEDTSFIKEFKLNINKRIESIINNKDNNRYDDFLDEKGKQISLAPIINLISVIDIL